MEQRIKELKDAGFDGVWKILNVWKSLSDLPVYYDRFGKELHHFGMSILPELQGMEHDFL